MTIKNIRENLEKIDNAIKLEYPRRTPFDFLEAMTYLKNVEKTGINNLTEKQKKELTRLLSGTLITLTNHRVLPDLFISSLPIKDWFQLLDSTVKSIKNVQNNL